MIKIKVKVVTLVLTIVLVLSTCVAASAAEAYFSGKKLYPTEWSIIKGVTKTNNGTYGTLSLDSISPITGSSYGKSYVNVRISASGTVYRAYANQSMNITLTGGFQTAGVYVALYGKSADRDHNCLVAGYWNAH